MIIPQIDETKVHALHQEGQSRLDNHDQACCTPSLESFW